MILFIKACGEWTSVKDVLKRYSYKYIRTISRTNLITLRSNFSETRLGDIYRSGNCVNSKKVYRFVAPGIFSKSCNSKKSIFHNRNSSIYSRNRYLWLRNSCDVCYSRRFYSENTNIVNQSIFYKALYDSPPILYAQEFLVYAHEISGLPWWATIVCGTVVLRSFITFPLALYQNYILAKLELVQLELKEISKEMGKETGLAVKKFNWTEKEAKAAFVRSMKKQWKMLIEKENCHPAKASLLVLVQLPMWVSLSLALRNLVFMLPEADAVAQITMLELSAGGALWFHNLVLPDSSWILPLTLGIANLTIVEIQRLSKTKPPSKIQKIFTNIFRVVSVIMVPIAASVPSCLSLYWVTSSTVGVIHNLLLLSPRVRGFVGIPITSSVPKQPYRHVYEQLAARLGLTLPPRPPSGT